MVDRAFERDILAISSSFVVGRNTRTQERRSFFDPRRDTEEGVVRFLFFSFFFFFYDNNEAVLLKSCQDRSWVINLGRESLHARRIP